MYVFHIVQFLLISWVIIQSDYMTAEDINIGIGAVLETFEMMQVQISALFHDIYILSKVVCFPTYTCLHIQTIQRNRHQRTSSDFDFSMEITRTRNGLSRNIS